MIGDSIAAGGRAYGRLDTLTFAANGAELHQIAASLDGATRYRPKRIMVEGGTNDAMQGPPDYANIRRLWKGICADKRVIAVLPTPTRYPDLNARLAPMRPIIRAECRKVIDLVELAGPDGLLRPEFSRDGVHLKPAAYVVWRRHLAAVR